MNFDLSLVIFSEVSVHIVFPSLLSLNKSQTIQNTVSQEHFYTRKMTTLVNF